MKIKNYQDYVIKDGQLIGKFDDMYREYDGVPWNQDKTAFGIFSDIDLLIIKKHKERLNYNSILEVGCGLGFFTKRLKNELGRDIIVSGMDISETAITKADSNFPDIDFYCANIASKDFEIINKYDLIVAKEILWYVLDHLEVYFNNLSKLSNNYIYISQSFPEVENYLGKAIFPDADSLIEYISVRFDIIYAVIEKDSEYNMRELAHVIAMKIDA